MVLRLYNRGHILYDISADKTSHLDVYLVICVYILCIVAMLCCVVCCPLSLILCASPYVLCATVYFLQYFQVQQRAHKLDYVKLCV